MAGLYRRDFNDIWYFGSELYHGGCSAICVLHEAWAVSGRGVGFLGIHLLPSIALASMPMAFIARLSRSSMIEVLNSDYIRTAKAKGLSRPAVTVRHAIRNALLPVVTYMGPMAAQVLTGSFIIETILGFRGLVHTSSTVLQTVIIRSLWV